MYFQITTVKYDADREITNIYENLQIVWSQFVTDMLLLVSIRSTSNIYSFIGIRICCQRIQTNSNSVTFDICTIRSGIRWTNPKVKKQLFAVTYFNQLLSWECNRDWKFCQTYLIISFLCNKKIISSSYHSTTVMLKRDIYNTLFYTTSTKLQMYNHRMPKMTETVLNQIMSWWV